VKALRYSRLYFKGKYKFYYRAMYVLGTTTTVSCLSVRPSVRPSANQFVCNVDISQSNDRLTGKNRPN